MNTAVCATSHLGKAYLCNREYDPRGGSFDMRRSSNAQMLMLATKVILQYQLGIGLQNVLT